MEAVDLPLPKDKLSLELIDHDSLLSSEPKGKPYVVLVSTGSFNPPTFMHLRCFELARDALNLQGFRVLGGYMSPVNDSYKKKGLVSAEHRITMCDLACTSSEFVMVDPWEVSFCLSYSHIHTHTQRTCIHTDAFNLSFTPQAKFYVALAYDKIHFDSQQAKQSTYQRTLTVLSRTRDSLCQNGLVSQELLKVMLVCGSDLLESFSVPGFWIRDQVKTICRDFGLVCIRRGDQDVQNIISKDCILKDYQNNIKLVDEVVPNGISSTGLRDCISRGLSVKYLTADEVINYIKQNNLYTDRTQ